MELPASALSEANTLMEFCQRVVFPPTFGGCETPGSLYSMSTTARAPHGRRDDALRRDRSLRLVDVQDFEAVERGLDSALRTPGAHAQDLHRPVPTLRDL
jgi:hypothetical protein